MTSPRPLVPFSPGALTSSLDRPLRTFRVRLPEPSIEINPSYPPRLPASEPS